MLVVMNSDATTEQIDGVIEVIRKMGMTPHPIRGKTQTAIGITGNEGRIDSARIEVMPGVVRVIEVTKPYTLASREFRSERTVIEVNGVEIGADRPVIVAGPCSVESDEQYLKAARTVQECGADMLRGGAFKPRSSPYEFQGLGIEGLKILDRARQLTGLPVVSEVLDINTFDLVERYVNIIQIGARNMQNFELLRRAGRSRRPVLLKRGMSATLIELLLAAEYIMTEGNYQVILCERGIRTFSDSSRFTLDLASIPELRTLTHLPLFVDPSHAAGRRHIVIPLARAGVAVGADGLIVEVHPCPEEALCDGAQALAPEAFRAFMAEIRGGRPPGMEAVVVVR
ncbi:MAG: 3-deoxy-7-phosphoheptulonate synthase [Candidatus Thorarchaeota archaeon]|nr:3-deoxy-7-phosphoheptulonate synthase [Candidatus Thorarchaeota archaeon]